MKKKGGIKIELVNTISNKIIIRAKLGNHGGKAAMISTFRESERSNHYSDDIIQTQSISHSDNRIIGHPDNQTIR
jgi:hypothetical protein